jgi:hypothetical protein
VRLGIYSHGRREFAIKDCSGYFLAFSELLAHRREQGGEEASTVSLGARAPPPVSLF